MTSMIGDKLDILFAYARKRFVLSHLRTEAHVQARQQRLLDRLILHATRNFSFYAPLSGVPFDRWPVTDKSRMLSRFHEFNAAGLPLDKAWAAAEEGLLTSNSSGQWGPYTVGTSTGTSGRRGVFLVTETEKRLWLGSILARSGIDFLFGQRRIALLLSTGNALYETSSRAGRLQFRFFDMKKGLDAAIPPLEHYDPDVLIGTPGAVAALASRGVRLNLRHVFTGGEVLDPLDIRTIHSRYGLRPRQIYQATEGFLGMSCSHGTLHLNEDDMLFEQEPIAGHPQHFVPVITDLRRRAQAMIRYRLDDILVRRSTQCPCGSPLTAIERIEGRCDDVVCLPRPHNAKLAVMPEALRAIILDCSRSIGDFRLLQIGERRLRLYLEANRPESAAEQARVRLSDYIRSLGADCQVEIALGIPDEPGSRKRRRICVVSDLVINNG